MRIFYNTNGFTNHPLDDVVEVLADLGYDGIALTPDVHHLDPYRSTGQEIDAFRARCERRKLSITIESGARFLLDPKRKHLPNLLSDVGHERRADLYRRLVDLAAVTGAEAVSIWSGTAEDGASESQTLVARLATRLAPLLDLAMARGVTLSFEPEPGMLVDTLRKYRELAAILQPRALALTIDLGHLAVTEAEPFERHLLEHRDRLTVVHADDARKGRHEHLQIGDGELDWPAIATNLQTIGFTGPVAVELSRHAHDAVNSAAIAIERLRGNGF